VKPFCAPELNREASDNQFSVTHGISNFWRKKGTGRGKKAMGRADQNSEVWLRKEAHKAEKGKQVPMKSAIIITSWGLNVEVKRKRVESEDRLAAISGLGF